MTTAERTIETKVPAQLDRLPWSRFHWMVIVGLGTIGGIAEILFGVDAEGKTLESIAAPLSAAKSRISGTEAGSGQEPPAAIV